MIPHPENARNSEISIDQARTKPYRPPDFAGVAGSRFASLAARPWRDSDENLLGQGLRDRQEMDPDRRPGPGGRPARLDHRHAAAWQAQAHLYPAYGLRRQCDRAQRRHGGADRPEAEEM